MDPPHPGQRIDLASSHGAGHWQARIPGLAPAGGSTTPPQARQMTMSDIAPILVHSDERAESSMGEPASMRIGAL